MYSAYEHAERERARAHQSRTRNKVVDATPTPAQFIRDSVIIDDAQGDGLGVMPFDLWPKQEELLDAIGSERLLLILKARQLGISWLVCAYALWLCMYRPGRVVLAFSKGQEEANELTRRVTVMYERLPEVIRAAHPMTKANTEEAAWANGSRFKSMPATPGAGRTFTASLAIMDEAAFMAYADKLYTSMKPTIDGGGQLIILSTANGRANLFYKLCERAQQGLGQFAFQFLPWQARPGRDAAWYAATEADAIDATLMKQEYPATPEEAFEATEVGAFLPSIALWDACRADVPPLDGHTPCVLALDAAESNDTFGTVIVSKLGEQLAVRYVRPYVPQKGQPLDFDEIEIDVRELGQRHAIQALVYDPMLLGQMVRRLQRPATLYRKAAPDVPLHFDAFPAPCVPFPQGAARLESDKGLFDLITQRRIVHDGNAELRAHVANTNKKTDAESRKLRIVKREYALKIDLCVALAFACARADLLAPAPTGFSFSYDQRRR